MDIHSHHEAAQHAQAAHPLGFILFWAGSIVGFMSLSFEQNINEISLLLGVILKLLSICSIILSVVIYWDKITANSRQMKKDFKDKFQKKHKK